MTKKRLIDRLRAEQNLKQPAQKGRVAILAHKKEIMEALNQGFTMWAIHAVMVKSGEMPVGYSAFTRLVNKYIKGKKTANKTPAKEPNDLKSHIYNPDDYDEKDLF